MKITIWFPISYLPHDVLTTLAVSTMITSPLLRWFGKSCNFITWSYGIRMKSWVFFVVILFFIIIKLPSFPFAKITHSPPRFSQHFSKLSPNFQKSLQITSHPPIPPRYYSLLVGHHGETRLPFRCEELGGWTTQGTTLQLGQDLAVGSLLSRWGRKLITSGWWNHSTYCRGWTAPKYGKTTPLIWRFI